LPDLGGGERFPARGAAMMLFIGSESLFFGALIYTYLHLRIHLGVWPPPGIPRLGLRLISINTVVLLSSSIPASRALAAFRRGNLRATRLWIALTMIMGMGFLAGEALEWSRVGFGLSSGVMGSTFFTLTGFHGLHVTVGLVLLAFMIVRTLRQQRAPETVAERGTAGLVTAGTYYWHFVDAVWVFIFSLVYLL
jgi:cytochrome c oxidase subunit 3